MQVVRLRDECATMMETLVRTKVELAETQGTEAPNLCCAVVRRSISDDKIGGHGSVYVVGRIIVIQAFPESEA